MSRLVVDTNVLLSSFLTQGPPRQILNRIRKDSADNMFLECALEARADCVISGDRHLKRIGAFGGIPILSPREYLTAQG